MSTRTEIVDAESLSVGARILAPNGKIWAVVSEPEEKRGGDLIELRLAVQKDEGPLDERVRTVSRTTKYEVICI